MVSNKIELKSVSELSGMKFFIPYYQRGYRWTTELVEDLLNDIDEFTERNQGVFYCLQPLVVKKNIISSKKYCEKLKQLSHEDNNLIERTKNLIDEYSQWEVIDGQQRLTTILILLKYLCSDENSQDGEKHYSIKYVKYEKGECSKNFFDNINDESAEKNIDFYHMKNSYDVIIKWFDDDDHKDKNYKDKFLENLLKNAKFIWYESVDEDPIKVFTRLTLQRNLAK